MKKQKKASELASMTERAVALAQARRAQVLEESELEEVQGGMQREKVPTVPILCGYRPCEQPPVLELKF